MPGASEEARRVKIMNANWVAGADGEDGAFELMIVTSDDRRHFVTPSPAAMNALVALTQADTVLVWDPADRTLIAANLRGTMPWTEEAAAPTDATTGLHKGSILCCQRRLQRLKHANWVAFKSRASGRG